MASPPSKMTRQSADPHDKKHGRVTVSIVSHGHGEYVRHLLEDLDAAGAWIDKVIVTRNIPEADLLDGTQPGCSLDLIDNPHPKGFGSNHNAAFARCNSQWFLVLNPDVRIASDALGTLLEHVSAATGVIAPRILEPGKDRPEPRRKLLTPFEIMGRWIRPDYDAPRAHWVPGAFMLLRTAAFEAVHGFDEKFFMYVEDADLCARLELTGWEVTVDESVRILHDAQRASDRNWRALGWHWASMLRWWFSAPFWRLLARTTPARRESASAASIRSE